MELIIQMDGNPGPFTRTKIFIVYMDNYECLHQFDNVLEELKRYFHFHNLNRDNEVVIKRTQKFRVLEIIEL